MKDKDIFQFRVSLSSFSLCVATVLFGHTEMISVAHARDYFNPALLERGVDSKDKADLSIFENKGGQTPGTYRVDIFINNQHVDTRMVKFYLEKNQDGDEHLLPCISVTDLEKWGVLIGKYPEIAHKDQSCAYISAIPQAYSDFRFDKQQLLLSFPQSAVSNSARGWVDPALWDEGITAALLNYSLSGSSNKARNSQGRDNNNQFANLRPGINIGPWRLRNYTTWSRTDQQDGETQEKWDTIYTYLQRDIQTLKSQFLVGDSSSPSDIFDSIPFRGAQLSSDDEMQPESLRGYAPVVRGIARTNAEVTVRQNGYVIYQTYVSPGSFEITDMYPTGGSGDLQVTIKESDGSEQKLTIPFASLPVLQREGRLKYSVTSGVYRSYDSRVEKTPFSQGTLIYGLPAGVTIFGGGQASGKYRSVAAGLGKNLGELGALSVDVTQAWSERKDREKESGRSLRARYSKNFLSSGTDFTIAGYRYATSGFWGMQEVMDTWRDSNFYLNQERRRNRAELTMTQSLGQSVGSVSLTGIREDYWNSSRRMESYGASYNSSWNNISFGLSYTYSRNSGQFGSGEPNSGGPNSGGNDQLFSFNISAPLDVLFGENRSRSLYASYMLNSSKRGNTTHSMSLNGNALDNNNLSWSLQEGYGTRGEGNSGSVNADWRATYGEVVGGYSYDKYNRRLNYGLQGGIIAHSQGVTLSQPLGETMILVEAPGAGGVSVNSGSGVKTDFRGYTVVPYSSPYRRNTVSLDTETMGDDTDVLMATQTVIPTRGAVVKANYKTSIGMRALMTLTRGNGQPVPFGAMVTRIDNDTEQEFIVGDKGQVYLTGLRDSGKLNVLWGKEPEQQCRAQYQVEKNKLLTGILNLSVRCL